MSLNYKHCVNHLPAPADTVQDRETVTIVTITTYFSLAWPSEGAPPDLLLYMFVGSFSAVIQPATVILVSGVRGVAVEPLTLAGSGLSPPTGSLRGPPQLVPAIAVTIKLPLTGFYVGSVETEMCVV